MPILKSHTTDAQTRRWTERENELREPAQDEDAEIYAESWKSKLKAAATTVAIQANYKEQEKQINVVQVKTKNKNKKIIKQVQYKQNI